MSEWIDVKDKLPPLDEVVLVHYPSHDNFPVYNWGARVDDGEGWCWGVKGGYGASLRIDKDCSWNDIEVDDDYPVTHTRRRNGQHPAHRNAAPFSRSAHLDRALGQAGEGRSMNLVTAGHRDA